MKMFRSAIIVTAALGISLMSGCAATRVAISHHSLEVHSKMTDSVFLQPSSAKTVYLDVKNTSDKSDFRIQQALAGDLTANGFQLVSNPDKAAYEVQVNILSVGKGAPTAEQVASSGFGAPINGAVSGMMTAAALSGHVTTGQLAGAGLIAGAADYISGALVKDVTYTAVADVQVSQRTADEVYVSGSQNLAQGSSGSEHTNYHSTSHFKRFRTRVFTVANKVNLDWEEAEPAMISSLSASIGGIL